MSPLSPISPISPQYVSEKEAAVYLGVSVSTIRRWRRKGVRPQYFQFGRVLRYSREALDRFAAEHTKPAE